MNFVVAQKTKETYMTLTWKPVSGRVHVA